MKNAEVAQKWSKGLSCKTKNYSTDGRDLYSYALRIGTTLATGEKIVYDFTGAHRYSNTTTRHVSYARRVADMVVDPE